jgi:sulfur transfer complex TusBCD TusB component (DsrH family)
MLKAINSLLPEEDKILLPTNGLEPLIDASIYIQEAPKPN